MSTFTEAEHSPVTSPAPPLAGPATEFSSEHYEQLTTQNLFLDAWHYCLQCWGPVADWQSSLQLEKAVSLFSHLGGDRDSDALMLRAWRRFPTDAEWCVRVLCYQLHRFGAIIAEKFISQHQALLAQAKDCTDLLAVQLCCQSGRKNYLEAWQLLHQAKALSPDNLWLDRLELMLLRDQQLYPQELALAQQLLQQKPRVSLVLDTARALVRNQQSAAAMTMLAGYAARWQSCRLWVELVQVSARLMDWSVCQQAIDGYRKLQQFTDRDDEDLLLASAGKIALQRQDLAAALDLFRNTRQPFYRKTLANLQQLQQIDDTMVSILPVPHVRQGHLTCAPATMAALCQFWQHPVTQQQIAAEICFDGTPDTLERQWLRDQGYAFIELELTPVLAYQLIAAGLPFALITTSGFSSHMQAVIGYHRGLGIVYLMEPSRDYIVEYQLESGLAAEAAHGPRALVFVPSAQAELLTTFANQSSQLYQYYDGFSLALNAQHLPGASQWLTKMQALNAEHRLTLIAARQLAIEHNDENLIAGLTMQLLERYPGQISWLSSRFFSLQNLGQGEAALRFLQNSAEETGEIDLKIRLFRQIYHLPHWRQHTLQLVRELEKTGSYYAEVYQLLADFYWQEKQYPLACRYYFYACCLDDTQQDFVESYFKASRYLQQTAQAISHLQARFEQYGRRSASPAMSLYHAYNWQNLGRQALEVLDQARLLRPEDQELVTFTLGELLYKGQLSAFEQLLRTSSQLLSPAQQLYWQAKAAEWQGDLVKAAEFFRQCFILTPWQRRVANAYFSALEGCGHQSQIVTELAQLAALDASHPELLNYQADWHPDAAVKSAAVCQLAARFVHSGDHQRRFIRQLLAQGQLNEARQQCEQLLQILPEQAQNRVLYARVLQQLQQIPAARTQLQQVLSHDVDSPDATELWLELHPAPQEQRRCLGWLVTQMQIQPQYGDALLDVSGAVLRLVDVHLHQQVLAVLAANTHVWSCRLAWSWLLAAQDPEAALAQLRLGIADFPLLPRLHLELAELLQQQQQEGVEQCYLQALQINPSYTRASRQLALYYEQTGELAKEIDVLQMALRFEPFNGVVHGLLADAYLRQEQPALAKEQLLKAVRFKTDYLWGWRTLQRICLKSDEQDQATLLALQLHSESPHLTGPLQALAVLSTQPDEKISYWKQAIVLSPANQDIHLALLDYLAERNQFSAMFSHVADYFPNESQPFAITCLLATAAEQTGHPEQALKMLGEAIEQYNPELKHWQQLFELLQTQQQKADIARFADLLQQRQPHDAMALCTAAEQYWWLGQQDEAMRLLDNALQLAPQDRYISLTQIDFLLGAGQNLAALQVAQALHQGHADVWVKARLLRACLACEELAQADMLWLEIIQTKTENTWLYDHPLDDFPTQAARLTALLQQHLASAGNVAGYCLGRRFWGPKAARELPALLQKMPAGLGWDGLCEAYLDYCADHALLPPTALLDRFSQHINAQPELAAKLANIYRVKTRLYQAAHSYQQIDPAKRPCYVSYHFGITLLELNRWPEALAVFEQGAASEPDNCFHNLQLWLIAVRFVLHSESPQAVQYINLQQLTESEQRVWHYLAFAASTSPTVSAAESLQKLRQIQRLPGGRAQPDRNIRVGRAMWHRYKSQRPAARWTQRLSIGLIGMLLF